MTLMETAQLLGNFGEFFGAIAVVATLVYLAAQIRQNTRSMDENRRLAIAQGYQTRSALSIQAQRLKADSRYIAEVLAQSKEDDFTVDSLDLVQRERLWSWNVAYIAETDNVLFQFEQGFITEEQYEDEFKRQVLQYGRVWMSMGLLPRLRKGFRQEVLRILDENSRNASRLDSD